MDLYARSSYQISRLLTLKYSSSFGLSSKLFARRIQPSIYAVYGLVRVADEIVDTYTGADKAELLDALENETYRAITRGYSTNPIVHAFALTATRYDIDTAIIQPFFESMRMDISPQRYTPKLYARYIHGSAEVIGLMCLKVFCEGDATLYKQLRPGAIALGAAYQKVNFLRDIASDYTDRGRLYFPGVTYETFSDQDKAMVVTDIMADFTLAKTALDTLPANSRAAVATSYAYYRELLDKLAHAPVETLRTSRIRISTSRKLFLLASTYIRYKVGR